jgi:hypothetical protein
MKTSTLLAVFATISMQAVSAFAEQTPMAAIGINGGYITKGAGVSSVEFGLNVDCRLPMNEHISVGGFTHSFVPDSSNTSKDYQTFFGVEGKYHLDRFARGPWAGAKIGISQYTDTYSPSIVGRNAGHFTTAMGPAFGYDYSVSFMTFGASLSYMVLPFLTNNSLADTGRGTFVGTLGFGVLF